MVGVWEYALGTGVSGPGFRGDGDLGVDVVCLGELCSVGWMRVWSLGGRVEVGGCNGWTGRGREGRAGEEDKKKSKSM